MKVCSQCKIPKECSEFYFNKKTNSHLAQCKLCNHKRCKIWVDKNREKRKEILKRYRERHLKRSCLICNSPFFKNGRSNVCSLKCRILENIEKVENGCWVWKGSNGGKYGKTNWGNKTISAHKASHIAFKGEVTKGLQVCHSCDNPMCVNPDHLWLGTAFDNMRDCVNKRRFKGTRGIRWTEEWRKNIMSKRRHADRKGEKHHLNKLSEQDVKEIRKMLKENLSQTLIAKKFGVHSSTISMIKTGRLWSHLN